MDVQNTKTQAKKINKAQVKKIAGIVANVLVWTFVAFSLLITILVFSAQSSKDGIPSLFGKSLVTIETDSMEDFLAENDLVVVRKLTADEIHALEPEAIIVYRAPVDLNGDGITGDINTHRILEHNKEKAHFVTKGDHNPLPDNQGDNPYTVAYANVVGVYERNLGGIGTVITFLRSSLGFFLCIVLPLILFFLYELYNFISILFKEKQKKALAAAGEAISKETEEEIKRRAVEEYLAAQKQAEEQAKADSDTESEEK